MTSQFIKFATLSVAILAVSACTTHGSVKDLPPGEYNSKTSTTNSRGTDTSVSKKTTVGYDAYGNKTAVIEKNTTTDPKGLFNKSKSSTTTTVK